MKNTHAQKKVWMIHLEGYNNTWQSNPLKKPQVETFCFHLKWEVGIGKDRWYNPHRYSPWRPSANLSTSYISSLTAREYPEGSAEWLIFCPGHERHPEHESCMELKRSGRLQAAAVRLNDRREQQVVAWEVYGSKKGRSQNLLQIDITGLNDKWNCLHYIVATLGYGHKAIHPFTDII